MQHFHQNEYLLNICRNDQRNIYSFFIFWYEFSNCAGACAGAGAGAVRGNKCARIVMTYNK